MKINKGMYCYDKSNRKAGIGKIIEFWKNNNVLIEYKNNINSVSKGNVVASFNIIDLIKVGDYVNGNKVTKLGFDKLLLHCKTIECHQEDLSRGYEGVTFVYTNNDIKDVVTKEQFNACKYVVERNGNNEY